MDFFNQFCTRQVNISDNKDARFRLTLRYFANINCSNAYLIVQICAHEIRFAHQTIGKAEAISRRLVDASEDRQRRS